jgi:hypothetical protein
MYRQVMFERLQGKVTRHHYVSGVLTEEDKLCLLVASMLFISAFLLLLFLYSGFSTR